MRVRILRSVPLLLLALACSAASAWDQQAPFIVRMTLQKTSGPLGASQLCAEGRRLDTSASAIQVVCPEAVKVVQPTHAVATSTEKPKREPPQEVVVSF